MLTLNSNILKIGNKWILPVQSGGVVPPEPTVYQVTTSATHGTVTASPTEGISGTEITLSNTPDTGYEFDSYTITGTGATLSGNILTIGTSDVSVVGNFVQGASYSRYEIVFTTTVNQSQVSMNALNITPSSGTTAGGNWGTYTVTSSDITKMTDASPNAQNFNLNISSDGYGALTLNFDSVPSGNTFTWMDCTGYWCPNGTNTATLYGIDSGNNRTQLDQISFTNTGQAQRSLSIS